MEYFYSQLNRKDIFLFHKGENFSSEDLLGAHFNENYTQFNLWAPNAESVFLTGDFNNWQRSHLPMVQFEDSGIWTISVKGVKIFHAYKYIIYTQGKEVLYKSDPYAFHSETRPGNASKVYDLKNFTWNDEEWFKKKRESNIYESPINIYELNFNSWKRHEDGNPYSYKDLTRELIPYIKSMNYTHIEIMPIMEHPFDGSWGYQVTGYFAATSRFGEPKDFMDFINQCHREGIGVILDWVPVHFCKDDFGLRNFDGRALYESDHREKAENPTWGTLNFDYSKKQVQSFLISNALFWHKYYHVDGLRVDAVSHMIYRKFAVENIDLNSDENKNLDAVEFIKKCNKEVFHRYDNTLMIAEESAAYPGVTKAVHHGGLGFNFKWNMGWMHDILEYFAKDPIYRKYAQDALTFSISYAFGENYILALSHDEVVHGKKSLLDKMPGSYEDKFLQLKLLLAYMVAHPGKKLTFMGTELAQYIEWNENQQLDWLLMDYESHRDFHNMVAELNGIYKSRSEFFQVDNSYKGFNWIEHENTQESIIIFERIDLKGSRIICIFNFTPVERKDYPVGVEKMGKYSNIFSTNKENNKVNDEKTYFSHNDFKIHGRDQYIKVSLPKYGGIFIVFSEGE